MISFIISAIVLVVIAILIVLPAMLKKNRPFSDEFDDYNVSIAKDRLKELKQLRDSGDITGEVYQKMFDELESTLAIDLSGMQPSTESKEEIAEMMVKQVMSPVYWEDSIKRMISLGVDTFIEVGPGKTLSSFIKKIDKSVTIMNVENKKSLEKTLSKLATLK